MPAGPVMLSGPEEAVETAPPEAAGDTGKSLQVKAGKRHKVERSSNFSPEFNIPAESDRPPCDDAALLPDADAPRAAPEAAAPARRERHRDFRLVWTDVTCETCSKIAGQYKLNSKGLHLE